MFRLVIFSCLFLATFAKLNSRVQASNERIVGGNETDITEVPYQVSLQYNGRHICGGSIIAAKFILTAAHCIKWRNINLFSIRAGSNYYYKDGQVIKVVKGTSHPYFNLVSLDCDAAVLELEENLIGYEGVQIATLAHTEPEEGDMALASGWGALESGKGNADKLQSVSVPVISRKFCQEKYSWENITEEMFCAGYTDGGKDSCKGDSGGPVVVNNKLAGIVSWAYGCASKNYPGVNTNVAKILPWIVSIIRK